MFEKMGYAMLVICFRPRAGGYKDAKRRSFKMRHTMGDNTHSVAKG
jgi:hypothetical protein